MITLLLDIIEVIKNIPSYFVWAIETGWNYFIVVINGIFKVAALLIPLPAPLDPPEYISAINWFFPIGAIISVGAQVFTGYIGFLAIRWIYKWSGNL